MRVRAAVSQNDLGFEFQGDRQNDFLESQPVAVIAGLHGHGQVDGVAFPLLFPGLMDEAGSRVEGYGILVDIDEKNFRVLVEIRAPSRFRRGRRYPGSRFFAGRIFPEDIGRRRRRHYKAESLTPVGHGVVHSPAQADHFRDLPLFHQIAGLLRLPTIRRAASSSFPGRPWGRLSPLWNWGTGCRNPRPDWPNGSTFW